MDEKELEKLGQLKQLLEDGKADSEEVGELFDIVLNLMASWKKALEKTDEENNNFIKTALQNLISEAEAQKGDLAREFTRLGRENSQEIKDSISSWSRDFVSKLEDLRKQIPKETDLSDIERQIKEVEQKIPKIPEELTPDKIIEKVNQSEEKIDRERIEGLDEELGKISKQSKGAIVSPGDVWRNGSATILGKLTVSDAEPHSPAINDLWVDIS